MSTNTTTVDIFVKELYAPGDRWDQGPTFEAAPRGASLSGRREMKEPSALARLALMHLERTTRWGVDRADLLRAAKIDEAQLRDPDARIPRAAIVRLWHAAASQVPDPAFGLRLGRRPPLPERTDDPGV